MGVYYPTELGHYEYSEVKPVNSIGMTYLAIFLLTQLEDRIRDIVPELKRNVYETHMSYAAGKCGHFLSVYPKDKTLILFFPGRLRSIPGKWKDGVSVCRTGRERGYLTTEVRNVEQLETVIECLGISLDFIGYHDFPEDSDDDYVIALTNGRYSGTVVNGIPHGMGRFEWDDGSVYEGDIANGVISGKGTFFRTDGTVIRGFFKNGRWLEEAGVWEAPRVPPTYNRPRVRDRMYQ